MIFRIRGNSWNQAPSDPADMCGIIFLTAVWHYTLKGIKISILAEWRTWCPGLWGRTWGLAMGCWGVDANNTQLRPSVGWGPPINQDGAPVPRLSVGLRTTFLVRVLLGSLRTPQTKALPLGSAKPKVPLWSSIIIKMGTSPGLSHLIFTDSWSECYYLLWTSQHAYYFWITRDSQICTDCKTKEAQN